VIFFRKLRTFSSLGNDERVLIFQALLLPLAVQLGFRTTGVSNTQARLRNWARGKATTGLPVPPESVIRLARRAQGVTRRLIGSNGTCLQRSLTLWAILTRRGVAVDLRVGFRRQAGAIEGHAWVEYQGEPINEAPEVVDTYTVTPGEAAFDLWAAGVRST
jgi:hypothetical protein